MSQQDAAKQILEIKTVKLSFEKNEIWILLRIGKIMKSVASCLPPECKEKITNHLARKRVVAKLKKAGQPRHKIIQVTGHASESSLDDYDEVTEDDRKQLSHIVSGHVPSSASKCAQTLTPSTSTSTDAVPLVQSQVHQQVAGSLLPHAVFQREAKSTGSIANIQ